MEAAKTKYQKQMQSLRASHASQSEIQAAEQAQELEAVKEELKLTQEKLMVSQKTARRSTAGSPRRRPPGLRSGSPAK